MHTCCWWQMVCCRAKMSFWGLQSLLLMQWMQMFCPLLSRSSLCVLLCQLLIIIVFKGSDFHNGSQFRERKRETGEAGRRGKNRKCQGLFFTLLTCLWQLCLLTCEWKKFQELKWSMPQSHDIHLTPPPSLPLSISASQLSPESLWSYYRPCPSGILSNIHHRSYEPLTVIGLLLFQT